MTTIKDVFKKSFLEGYANADITIESVVVVLLITALLSLYIFMLYRVITRKTFYNKNFNTSLVGVALITAGIIITIQSSVVVSLGMVGALSIVRFRTAVKDPMDLTFLFWAISTGIICGAGFAEYAILLALALTIMILFLNHIPVSKAPLILVVNANNIDIEKEIISAIKKHAKYVCVKSRNMTSSSLDMTIEIRSSQETELVREVMQVSGVYSAALIAHDGEVTF